MSLINDALKRANQTRKQQPTSVQAGPAMQPMVTANRPSSLAPMVFIAILVLFLVGLGTLLLVRGYKLGQPNEASTPPVEQASAPMTSAPIPPVLTNQAQPEIQPAIAVARPSKPIVNTSVVVTIPVSGGIVPASVTAKNPASPVAAKPEKPVAVAVEEATTPASPSLRLQGIYYRRSNPSAMINGHSAFLGDEVDGARVVAIERTSVIVELKGQKQVLHMP